MKIRKGGIFKSIDSKDFGIYQKQGWEKVITETFKKLEELNTDTTFITEEPIKEVVQEDEVVEEVVIPKSKKRKNN